MCIPFRYNKRTMMGQWSKMRVADVGKGVLRLGVRAQEGDVSGGRFSGHVIR